MVGGVWSEKVRKNGWNGTSPNHLDRRARSGFSDLRRVGKRKRWKDHNTGGAEDDEERDDTRSAGLLGSDLAADGAGCGARGCLWWGATEEAGDPSGRGLQCPAG